MSGENGRRGETGLSRVEIIIVKFAVQPFSQPRILAPKRVGRSLKTVETISKR